MEGKIYTSKANPVKDKEKVFKDMQKEKRKIAEENKEDVNGKRAISFPGLWRSKFLM